MARDCVSKQKAEIMRAAVISNIRLRKIRQKDIAKRAAVTPQYVYDVLHAGRAISRRMHAIFKQFLHEAYPDLPYRA